MSLLQGKSWIAQDLYNEYLELKVEIPRLVNARDYYKQFNKHKEVEEFQQKIDENVQRLKLVMSDMENHHNIDMKDLILLSIGIDV